MRRMPGATGSSRPYSKANSRRNGMSTGMAGESTRVRRGCRHVSAAEKERVMKIKLDVDCTAEEARRFLGLPDVQPLQEALLDEVQQQMSANIKAMDP
ncbi:MAG: DUF6489 family protein, partial [Stellaceae bacterium]